MSKSEDVGGNDGNGGDPASSIAGPIVTNRLSLSDAATVSELAARFAMQNRPANTLPTNTDDPDAAPIPLPTLRSGQRFASVPELQRATQETALAEWNSNPKRHPWRRNGATAVYVHPPPIRANVLYYLSRPGVERVRRWGTRDSRIQAAKRAAVKLLQELVSWVRRAKSLVAVNDPEDPGEAALRMVESVLSTRFLGNALDTREVGLEEKLAPFATVRLRRSDYRRQWIVWKIELMFEQNSCHEPTVRELALASILCGLLPEGLKVGKKHGATAAEAIAEEMRAMRLARKRLRAEDSHSRSVRSSDTGNTR